MKCVLICAISLSRRTWHKRWVIASREAILFAKVNTDNEFDGQVIDLIPLSEVEGVCCAETTGGDSSWHDVVHGHKKPEPERKSGSLRQSSSIRFGDKIKFWHSFQIRTAVDGYNSGRTYHLQATSSENCTELVGKLAAAADAAKKAKEAKTRFEQSQVCSSVGKALTAVVLS